MQFFSLYVLCCCFFYFFSIASSSVYDYNILISSDLTKKKKFSNKNNILFESLKLLDASVYVFVFFFLFHFHVFPFRLLRLSRFTILVSLHSVAEALLSIY